MTKPLRASYNILVTCQGTIYHFNKPLREKIYVSIVSNEDRLLR